jgi:hypothetical protein
MFTLHHTKKSIPSASELKEVEIGNITVQGQVRQKVSDISPQQTSQAW